MSVLGWTDLKLRDSAADRWTWLVIAAYAQRRFAGDIRLSWQRPCRVD